MADNQILRREIAKQLRMKAARYVNEAVEVTASIMRDDAVPSETRLKAANQLFDRAVGRPTQEVVDEAEPNEQFEEALRKASEAATFVLLPRHDAPTNPMIEDKTHTAEITVLQPRRRRYLTADE